MTEEVNTAHLRKDSTDSSTTGSFERISGVSNSADEAEGETSTNQPPEMEVHEKENASSDEIDQDDTTLEQGVEYVTMEEVILSEDVRGRALTMLVVFSVAMFTVPFIVILYLYNKLIEDGYSASDAALYSGITGVAVVIIICGLFVWVAYRDESDYAKRKLEVEGQPEESKKYD